MPAERGRADPVKIEVLYFDGCPNHEALLPRLGELLDQVQVASPVELVDVPDDAAAQRERFLGSPTLRVDGRDVEPGAELRTDFGLKCAASIEPKTGSRVCRSTTGCSTPSVARQAPDGTRGRPPRAPGPP
jgi:hypothetical protein